MYGRKQGIRRYISLMGALCIFFHDLDFEPQRLTTLTVDDMEYAIVRNLKFLGLGNFKREVATMYVDARHLPDAP